MPSYEILIVGRHDGDTPEGALLIKAEEDAKRAAICHMRNLGARSAKGDSVIFLDDDASFTDGWYESIRDKIDLFDITGCRVVTPSGERWYDWNWASRTDPECPTRMTNYEEKSDNAYISGCFMMVKKAVFDSVKFNEELVNHQRDDVDFCHRSIDAGFSIGMIPEATLIHHLDPAGRSDKDPASGSTRFSEGVNLYRLGEYQKALDIFDTMEGLNALYHKGLSLMELGKFNEALPVFCRVIGTADSVTDRRIFHTAHFHLGTIAERGGDFAGALNHYRTTLTGFPEHKMAALGLERVTS